VTSPSSFSFYIISKSSGAGITGLGEAFILKINCSESFFSVLNALPQQIAVIDSQGTIRWVNNAWKTFAEENGAQAAHAGEGTRYLSVCRAAVENGDADGVNAAEGISAVLCNEKPFF